MRFTRTSTLFWSALCALLFVGGLVLGPYLVMGANAIIDLLNSLTTLLAAFGGVFIAFSLERRTRNRERRDRELEAANRLLYSLYERLNTIKLFQIDFVDPTRDHPGQMVSMRPVFSFGAPSSTLNIQDVAFMFQTNHKEELLALHVCEQKFVETVNAIRLRSDIHLNVLQPLLEKAGYQMGAEITDVQIRQIIGDRNYEMLLDATKAVVYHVDTFIQRGEELREKLIRAFSDVFSAKEVFKFEYIEEPLHNPPQGTARESRRP